MNLNNEDIYIIPHNYTDNGKILGIFEKQSFFLAFIWFALFTFLNFKFLPFSVDIKIFAEILVVIPPSLFILIGVGGDTLLDFLHYVVLFYQRARIYCFEK